MAIEVSQNENISGGKSARKKAVGLAVCRREANRRRKNSEEVNQ